MQRDLAGSAVRTWCVCALVFSLHAASAAQDTSRSLSATVLGDGMVFLHGAGYVLSAPLRWEGRDWAVAGGVAAGTLGSALLDNDALRLMNRNRTFGSDRLSDVVVRYGDGVFIIPLAGGAYLAGLLLRDRWLRETAFLTLSAVLISGAVSTAAKVVAGRARPYMNLGNHSFRPWTFSDDDYLSFPSGHAIVAFSVSGVLARRIGNPWATAGLYVLAGSTGWSRMYTRDHWLSDVLFSAATATAVSSSLVSWFEGEGGAEHASGLRIVPSGNGFSLLWAF